MFIQVIGLAVRLFGPTLPDGLESQLPPSSYMALGAPVIAPAGFMGFCQRHRDQCGVGLRRSGADSISPLSFSGPRGVGAKDVEAITPNGEPASGPDQGLRFGGRQASENALMLETAAVHPSVPRLSGPTGAQTWLGEPGALAITGPIWSTLNEVNRSINAKIQPMTDERAFGVSNYWTLPIEDEHRAVGNCKHYALEKRKALVDAGISPDALSLAIVRTGAGELHAVLIVATDHGEMVLDNLTSKIRGWRDAHYLWLARQTPGRPLNWVLVAAAS